MDELAKRRLDLMNKHFTNTFERAIHSSLVENIYTKYTLERIKMSKDYFKNKK